jgi:hypothetical protein
VVLIDGDQQPFPRPVSNPFAHGGRRIRRNGADLLDDLTYRQSGCSDLWRTNRERYGAERAALHVPFLLL